MLGLLRAWAEDSVVRRLLGCQVSRVLGLAFSKFEGGGFRVVLEFDYKCRKLCKKVPELFRSSGCRSAWWLEFDAADRWGSVQLCKVAWIHTVPGAKSCFAR